MIQLILDDNIVYLVDFCAGRVNPLHFRVIIPQRWSRSRSAGVDSYRSLRFRPE